MSVSEQARRAREQGELSLRIASALALAAAALLLAYLGRWAFMALVVAVALAMSWEWSNIVRRGGFDAAFMVQVGAVTAASIAAVAGYFVPAVGLVFAAGLVVLVMQRQSAPMLSGLGVLYVGLPAMALLALRHDLAHGFVAVVFVLVMVWTSDTFALVSGRSIGGPRLWPALSPKKTWAGLIGGVTASGLVAGLIFAPLIGAPLLGLAATGLVLGLAAQIGDLAESALKRACGVKDASDLIPGHGGFLDRLDGVVVAAPLALLIGVLGVYAAPAKALLQISQ